MEDRERERDGRCGGREGKRCGGREGGRDRKRCGGREERGVEGGRERGVEGRREGGKKGREGGRERYCRFPFASNRPVPDSSSVQWIALIGFRLRPVDSTVRSRNPGPGDSKRMEIDSRRVWREGGREGKRCRVEGGR